MGRNISPSWAWWLQIRIPHGPAEWPTTQHISQDLRQPIPANQGFGVWSTTAARSPQHIARHDAPCGSGTISKACKDGPLRTFNRATAAAARRHRSCLPSSPQHFQRPEVCRGGQGRRGWPSGLWDGLRRSRRGRPFVCVCRPPGRHSDQRICAQTKRIISVEASGPAGSA